MQEELQSTHSKPFIVSPSITSRRYIPFIRFGWPTRSLKLHSGIFKYLAKQCSIVHFYLNEKQTATYYNPITVEQNGTGAELIIALGMMTTDEAAQLAS